MKVRVQLPVEYAEVNLSPHNMRTIACAYIRQIFQLPETSFIDEKGQLIEVIEYHGSHSWTTDSVIRTATEDDKLAFAILNRL